jgi:colicin import membrane protein
VLEERERHAEAERKKREQQEAERRKQQQEEEAKRRVATAEAQQKAQARATATAAAEEKRRQEVEQQIVAAAKRLQEQAGERGAGTGGKKGGPPGGPLSVGPGQGAGGQVMGVDYVLYLGQLERRLKNNWAWAGTNEALEAVVGFSILPDGKVVNVRILKPSGDRSFDLSVERTVRALDPMPPPPEAYRELFGDVQYTFNAKSMQE